MRALTVAPGIANSAQLDEVPDPPASDGAVLVRTLAPPGNAVRRRVPVAEPGAVPPS